MTAVPASPLTPPPDALIRPATTEDRDACVALWTRCGLTRPWNDAGADFDLARSSGHGAVLVAVVETDLAGAVMVGHDGHRGAVYYLGVAPDRRRAGLGRRLVAAAEDWCRARGLPKVNLLVRKENAGVLAFYAALGYADTACVSLYRTLDDAAAAKETAAKTDWARRLAGEH